MKKIILLLSGVLVSLQGICQKPVMIKKDVLIQMAFVKAGTFFMGCDDPKFLSEEYDNERPIHRVGVSSYYIGKTEVTQGQWRTIMGVLPEAYTGVDYANKDCDNCPVVKVNYDEVQEFINKLNEKYPDKHYRLPTETEWEYAARGGQYAEKYDYSGSDKIGSVAWFGKPKGAAHEVAKKMPNELGIYDMSGNVAEWCTDWYDEAYYKKTIDAIDPKGPLTGDKRIVRGGSYFDDAAECRSVNRARFPSNTRQWNIGFRLVAENP